MELGKPVPVARGSRARAFGFAALVLGAFAAFAFWGGAGSGEGKSSTALAAPDPCAKYDGDMAASCKRCGGDATGVFTCDRGVLPTFPPESSFDVFYAESPLTGSKIARALGLYHSGVTVVRKDGNRERMTLQWYAIDGFVAAVMPQFGPSGPEWKNDAKVAFTREIDDDYWENQVLLATVDSAVINKYFDFVVDYNKVHPGYELFSVQEVQRKGATKFDFGKILVEDKICDTFTRDSVYNLQSQGATIIPEKIRYNSMRMFASTAALVDVHNKITQKKMLAFYTHLQQLLNKIKATAGAEATRIGSRKDHLEQIIGVVKRGFSELPGGLVFVGSPSTGMYEATVRAPFFTLGSLWIDTKTHASTAEPEIGSR